MSCSRASLTGCPRRSWSRFGDRFPMIGAHKVLAAYGCLVPRIVTGQFDPTEHKAVWPSTGNYCRGGVAISRILGCRGVAVLPDGHEPRALRLARALGAGPVGHRAHAGHREQRQGDLRRVRASSTRTQQNIIFNQFCEFGNHLVHYHCHRPRASTRCSQHPRRRDPELSLARSCRPPARRARSPPATRLKEQHGTRIVAVEAAECPTLLDNGYGEHNIQGIGDKHVPLIHNVMNTDCVVGVSDAQHRRARCPLQHRGRPRLPRRAQGIRPGAR